MRLGKSLIPVPATLYAGMLAVGTALAADLRGIEIQRRQADQLEHIQARLISQTDKQTVTAESGGPEQVVVPETPCFTPKHITWINADAFPWLMEKGDFFKAHCLGGKSLQNLRDYLNVALLERGFITSRVIYPKQNLNSGVLTVQLVPGRISAIQETGQTTDSARFALVPHPGDLLNQRDIDQSLENFRRLRRERDARIDLLPGKELGDTELHIAHGTGKWIQGNITLDDAGSDNTGQYQLKSPARTG